MRHVRLQIWWMQCLFYLLSLICKFKHTTKPSGFRSPSLDWLRSEYVQPPCYNVCLNSSAPALMHRAQASTVPLAALGKAANSQPWNIKYMWPGEHILQNGSDPAWGVVLFPQRTGFSAAPFSLHSSKSVLVFFLQTPGNQGEVTISQQEEGKKNNNI